MACVIHVPRVGEALTSTWGRARDAEFEEGLIELGPIRSLMKVHGMASSWLMGMIDQ